MQKLYHRGIFTPASGLNEQNQQGTDFFAVPSDFLYNYRMDEVYELGDLIVLKKKHPCGSNEWKVVRLGAEIGLECLKCQHRILLTRRELSHKKKNLPNKPTQAPENPA